MRTSLCHLGQHLGDRAPHLPRLVHRKNPCSERVGRLFTRTILDGLSGRAAGPDGIVSSQTLYAYLSKPLGQAGAPIKTTARAVAEILMH